MLPLVLSLFGPEYLSNPDAGLVQHDNFGSVDPQCSDDRFGQVYPVKSADEHHLIGPRPAQIEIVYESRVDQQRVKPTLPAIDDIVNPENLNRLLIFIFGQILAR